MLIEICSRKDAPVKVERNPSCNAISIVDCGHEHPFLPEIQDRIDLKFDDIAFEHDMGPAAWHIAKIIRFARRIDERPLIVHCKAGISRSAAAAFIVYAVKFGPAGIRDHFRPMLGLIYPNAEMLRLADGILGNDGALIAAGDHFRNWDLLVEFEKTKNREVQI
jgi:predicted protein tyrosine phosphatase